MNSNIFFGESGKNYQSLLPDTSLSQSRDSLLFTEQKSLTQSNSKKIDNFLLERSNFFSPVHLINFETNSFLLDMGFPSNFYELSLLQFDNRSNAFFINTRQLNEPLTNLIDLRDLRFEEYESLEIIFPTRAFLISRYNSPNAFVFNERIRFSSTPLSRVKYIEAPYDNLFFDGYFNVNLSRRINFEFGITKHNTPGRFLNSEKDLWAGKLKFSLYPTNKINLNLIYRYSKSLSRFNEGVNINNPLLQPGESIESIIYDNQRALVINDDAYHKWTLHNFDLSGALWFSDHFQTYLSLYFLQSLREFRDNERKIDSLRFSQNHWSKVFGLSLRQNINYLFNQIELNLNYERLNIETPSNIYNKFLDDFYSFYFLYQINLHDKLVPSFYMKTNIVDNGKKIFHSLGSDLTIKANKNFNLVLGLSSFKRLFSYDERLLFSDIISPHSQVLLASGELKYSSEKFKFSTELYFKRENRESQTSSFYSIELDSHINDYLFNQIQGYGITGDFSFSFWKINSRFKLSFNDNYVYLNGEKYHKIIYPRFQGAIEISFHDNFFKSSLDLLSGIRMKFFSSYSGRSFSPSKLVFVDIRKYENSLLNFATITIPSNFTIDIFVSGGIKKSAVVYFSLENILNKKYYLIPYYPVNDIQFRFGISWEFYD